MSERGVETYQTRLCNQAHVTSARLFFTLKRRILHEIRPLMKSIAIACSRTGVANRLMEYLEEVSTQVHDCYFVDLFVRATNSTAITFYQSLGYVVYRTVQGYYSGDKTLEIVPPPPPRWKT
eukprot:1320629-Amphidinium_carterae.1